MKRNIAIAIAAAACLSGCSPETPALEDEPVGVDEGKADNNSTVTKEKIIGYLADAAPTGRYPGTLDDGSPCIIETVARSEQVIHTPPTGEAAFNAHVAFTASWRKPTDNPDFYLVLKNFDDRNATTIVGRVTHTNTRLRVVVNQTHVDSGASGRHTLIIKSPGFEQGVASFSIDDATCTMDVIGL